MISLRRPLSIFCAVLMASPAALPQQSKQSGSTTGNWWQGRLTEPYSWRDVAPINVSNSNRLDQLLRAGKLYLSLQDVIALALENNLDIELQRYGPKISQADLDRANSGGAVRAAQNNINSGTTGGGGGIVSGIQSSSQGVGSVSTGSGLNVQNLDPVFTSNLQFAKQTQPQTTLFNTGTSSLISQRTNSQFGINKAFLTGTSVSICQKVMRCARAAICCMASISRSIIQSPCAMISTACLLSFTYSPAASTTSGAADCGLRSTA